MRAAALALAAALIAAPASAQAPQSPQDRAREAAAMITAAGFTIRGAQILNGCERPARPAPTAVDLNGDGRMEAIVTDADAGCYGPGGAMAAIIWRDPAGRWRKVGGAAGRIRVLPTATRNWRDYTIDAPGPQPVWAWNGEAYFLKAQAQAGAPPPKAAVQTAGSAADRAAAFRAAGFAAQGGGYPGCNGNPLEIELKDLNGDGRLDAVVRDAGSACYGQAEMGWVLVTKEPGGAWRRLSDSPGFPQFLATRGAGGWPDIMNGGPGFCHPVLRWSGSEYRHLRWHAEQPGACAGRR